MFSFFNPQKLCKWVDPHLQKEQSLPTDKKMLTTVWMLGNKAAFQRIADIFGLNKGSLYRVVMDFCKALTSISSDDIKWPEKSNQRKYTEDLSSRLGLPGVVGAIDGTHIAIPGPLGDGHRNSYISRKGFPNIQLQVECNTQSTI